MRPSRRVASVGTGCEAPGSLCVRSLRSIARLSVRRDQMAATRSAAIQWTSEGSSCAPSLRRHSGSGWSASVSLSRPASSCSRQGAFLASTEARLAENSRPGPIGGGEFAPLSPPRATLKIAHEPEPKRGALVGKKTFYCCSDTARLLFRPPLVRAVPRPFARWLDCLSQRH